MSQCPNCGKSHRDCLCPMYRRPASLPSHSFAQVWAAINAEKHQDSARRNEMKPIALSIPETGKVLGGEDDPLSRNTIYRMIARGELDAFKLGTRTMITVASIEAIATSAPRLNSAS